MCIRARNHSDRTRQLALLAVLSLLYAVPSEIPLESHFESKNEKKNYESNIHTCKHSLFLHMHGWRQSESERNRENTTQIES